MSEFLHSLINQLTRQGLTPLMAGGWAVNHFGFTRATRDIDFVFSKNDRDTVIQALESSGFSIFSNSNIATRFKHHEVYLPIVDAIWVDPATHAKMINKAQPSQEITDLHYLALEHLLAMKFHALHDHDDRQGKDLADIKQLIKANPNTINQKELVQLCEKYAPAWAKGTLFSD